MTIDLKAYARWVGGVYREHGKWFRPGRLGSAMQLADEWDRSAENTGYDVSCWACARRVLHSQLLHYEAVIEARRATWEDSSAGA